MAATWRGGSGSLRRQHRRQVGLRPAQLAVGLALAHTEFVGHLAHAHLLDVVERQHLVAAGGTVGEGRGTRGAQRLDGTEQSTPQRLSALLQVGLGGDLR